MLYRNKAWRQGVAISTKACMCAEQHLWCAAAIPEGAAEADNAPSETGTEGESATVTEAALMQAQHAQHEAMLVSQDSLNDSCERLLGVREAMQQSHQVATGA